MVPIRLRPPIVVRAYVSNSRRTLRLIDAHFSGRFIAYMCVLLNEDVMLNPVQEEPRTTPWGRRRKGKRWSRQV